MRDVPHDAEIVRDEEIGEAQLRLQVGEEVEDLRLDRDVERRDRLVGDDELRREHERAGDRDALALAAGEHVRIATVVLGPQADLRHHRPGALCALRSVSFVLIASGSSRIAPTFLRGLSEP